MVGQVSEALIAREAVPDAELVGLELATPTGACAVLARRRGEDLQVWLNACPHAGRRLDYLPGRFLCKDGRLVCAAHGAVIDLGQGDCIEGPGRGGRLQALAVTPAGASGWRVVLPPP